MKVFFSCSERDRGAVDFIRAKIEGAGHQVHASLEIDPGEDISQGVEEMLIEADAYVLIISPGLERDRWLQWEWRKTLEVSWENENKPLVGVIIGPVEPPPFLQARQCIRIENETELGSATAQLLQIFDLPNNTSATVPERVMVQMRRRMEEVATEISKFDLSAEDLEEQRDWISDKIGQVAKKMPDSLDVAKLQIKLSDVLRMLGNVREAVPALEKGLEILQRNQAVPARKLAQVHAKLASALMSLEDNEGALKQVFDALRTCGIRDSGQVQETLRQCVNQVPALADMLSDTIAKVGDSEAARKGRQILDSLQEIDLPGVAERAGTKRGGDS